MSKKVELEKIADYAWLGKTQRSWHLWLGNPFCVGKYIIPLKKVSREQIIKDAIKSQKMEKRRFAKKFPHVTWESL